MLIFYDFEVFKHDWLVVLIQLTSDGITETVIINDKEALEAYHAEHKGDIWVGWNSRTYDQYILKAILCEFNPKEVNDFIIAEGQQGWAFSTLLRKIPLNNYDAKNGIDHGLKVYEGYMGHNIKECSVPFDIDRPLTQQELEETVGYCRYDVEQTMEIFLQRLDDFHAHRGLVEIASDSPDKLKLSLISKTKPQLSAQILGAEKRSYRDEFDIDLPSTLQVDKYTDIPAWYMNPDNQKYKVDPDNEKSKNHKLDIIVAGSPHVFGWGGLHGAREKYHGEGYYLNIDVASYYPTLMIHYGLISRSVKNPAKFEEIYHQRLKFKKEKNPLQLPLKLVLNSTYGAMKDKSNPLYDPLQANKVCVYGQLLLLDLIERLEAHCELIQSNTDGILIKLRQPGDYELIDDLCYEWEQRTGMVLEFEEFTKVFQKDVNNYIIVDAQGQYKSKGGYVKKLHNLDYDLPIINMALVAYMVHGVPVEKTIGECQSLKDFQLVSKITSKYTAIYHGDVELKERCIRLFASTDPADAGVMKRHREKGTMARLTNSPDNCFIINDNINDMTAPSKLDRQFYINMARKRLQDFGVIL